MGQIAFAVGGATAGLIGGIFLGNPLLGAAIGFSAGTALGNYIYGTRKADIGLDGPRMGDNTVQSSTYGATLPKVYGRWRLAGNLIWSSGIYDRASGPVNQNQGNAGNEGKGGAGQPNDAQFVASFAIAVCEGPIDQITRIWADGRLIFNNTGATVRGVQKYMNHCKFYYGTDDQTQDPTMAAAVGSTQVPDYLDVVYVVFTEIELLEFGNRIPNFTFEVVSTASAQYPLVNGPASQDADDLLLSRNAQEIYSLTSAGVLKAVRRTNNTVRLSRDIVAAVGNYVNQVGNVNVGSKMFVNIYDDHLWIAFQKTDSLESFLVRFDPQTLTPNYSNYSARTAGKEVEGIVNFSYIATADFTGAKLRFYQFGGDHGSVVRQATIDGPSVTARPGNFTTVYNKFYLLSYEPGSNPGDNDKFYITRLNMGEVWHATYSGNGRCKAVFGYDSAAANPQLVIGINDTAKLLRINTGNTGQAGPVTSAATVITTLAVDANQASAFKNKVMVFSTYFWFKSDDTFYRLTLTGGQDIEISVETASWTGTGATLTGCVHEPTTDSLWVVDGGTLKNLLFNRFNATTITLDAVVGDLLQKAGLSASDYDVAQLASKTVYGYAVTRQMPLREALKPLANAYQFEAVESEAKIKFVVRGSATVFPFATYITGADTDSIIENDLGVTTGDDPEEKVSRSRAVDDDLPVRVSVSYLNYNRDYNEGMQSQQHPERADGPQVTLELPMALSDAFARDLADKLFYTAWTERETGVVRTFWRYILLDPCDVITYQADGKRYTDRISSMNDGATGVLELNLTQEDTTVYSVTTTPGPTDSDSPLIDWPSPSVLYPLDIPILRPFDNNAGWYVGAAPLTDAGSWRGAVVQRSIDGTSFGSTITIKNQAIVGTVEQLPKTTYPGNIFDPGDSLTVRLANGADLTSAAEIDVLNGANLICLGNGDDAELIQFIDASGVGDLYTLSNLLRGRKGTERSVKSHAIGDRIIVVTEDSLRRVNPSSSEINSKRILRGTTLGTPVTQAPVKEFTNTGVGLKPYAGVQPSYTMDGLDFIVLWFRRTRLGGEWADYVDVPIGEFTEEYLVEFSDDGVDFSKFSKTFNTPEATLTSAEQGTYFGGAVMNLYVRIYQMSAEIGRGYPLEAGPFLNTGF